jgi:hypothetical protein
MNIFSKYSRLLLSLATVSILVAGCKDDEDPTTPPVDEDPQATITALNPDSGPTGTTVEIQGSNFNPDAEDHVVTFNGAEAEILGVTDKLITVTVPDDATTGNVSLSTGGQTTEGPMFTVSEPETGISFISPTSGVAGQQVRIHGNNFDPESDMTFYFNDLETSIRSVEERLIIVAVPEGVSSGMVRLNMDGVDYEGPEFTVVELQNRIEFSDGFAMDAGMATLGQAFIYEGGGLDGNTALRLTPAKADRTGVAYYGSKVAVQEGFETTFDFRITRPGQPEDATGEKGADGFSFIIQNEGLEAYGNRGAAMGYGGISNAVVVEFDIYKNERENEDHSDPDGNHISVQTTVEQGPVHPEHNYSIGAFTAVPELIGNESEFHTARILYTPGTLQIFIDDQEEPFEVELTLEDRINLDEGSAFVGFTASTNPEYGWAAHDILTWTFEPAEPGSGEDEE